MCEKIGFNLVMTFLCVYHNHISQIFVNKAYGYQWQIIHLEGPEAI